MKKSLQSAFTLIELLVVITIIAILAGIALPVFSGIQERGQQTKALAQAKQIGVALKLYASDFDGLLPGDGEIDPATGEEVATVSNSCDAFAMLIDSYVPTQDLFYVALSEWSSEKPDDDFESDGELTDRLPSGINHFAYVKGLTENNNPRLPLVADGFAEGSVGQWATEGKGGVWKGKKAIVVRLDQSGSIENIFGSDNPEMAEETIAGETGNIFGETVLPDSAEAINPRGGGGGDD